MNDDIFSPSTAVTSRVNLSDLNEAQYEAVTTTDGPVLVIAGAGSGKTRTLVYRVAHLVEKGVSPESILLLTFTRRASQEMLWRAGQLLNENCSRVVGGTFHSVANLLLRRYGSRIGFNSSFTIIDRADAEGIMNLLRSSLGVGKADKRFPTKRLLINLVSGSVNRALDLDQLVEEQYSHLLEHLEDILKLRDHYRDFKFDHGLMDYDDLLVNWKRLMVEDPEVQQQISARFSHIMVDEYQDTNQIQAEIVRLAACSHDNVMVVGDDSQSIYSFRGADFYNIMRFPEDYPGAKIVKLEENYRSTQSILSLTNDIIRSATEKYTKTLFTRREGERLPQLLGAADEREEAAFVVRTIRALLDSGVPAHEIAVLFRSGFHSYKLEIALSGEGMDYEKRGGLKLTESAHMKDMLAFFRVLVNPQDSLSWSRILLQLERVGPATAQKIAGAVAVSDDPYSTLCSYKAGKAWKEGYSRLVQLMGELINGDQRPGHIFEKTLQYYEPILERLYHDDYPKRQKDIDQLKSIMEGYSDLQSFIDDTALDPPDESSDKGAEGLDRIVLSTIHSSKGLEFDAVFVIGLADGRFPHSSAGFGEQWEEERRLLYVAATRAKEYLYLTYPKQMMTADRQFRWTGKSPFLAELSGGLYQTILGAGERASTVSWSAPAAETAPVVKKRKTRKLEMADFSVGTKVKHPFFGNGTVAKLSAGRSIDVKFDRHGMKTLHLDYAKLELL